LIRQTSNKPLFAGNPIANVLVVIVGALAIGAFIVLGVVAFVALGGILVIMAAILGIRLWWLDRKLGKKGGKTATQNRSAPGDHAVIEGEFRVVNADPDEKRSD
jgi:protein-S-isoprenylcysteine O-methyltransferase Ste14